MLFLASLFVACSATESFATTVSTDDPERCGERGATVHRTVGALTQPTIVLRTAPATPVVAPVRKTVAVAMRKPAKQPVRAIPNANAPASPTPGMGILQKMANGTSGGEVTWAPAKPNDNINTGASWIL